jgi:hypothetical protein
MQFDQWKRRELITLRGGRVAALGTRTVGQGIRIGISTQVSAGRIFHLEPIR